ncbi:PepSY domain-containing protein [Bosea sp. TWI1241]|uniref:PepSY domain-containing protein n=1 Tax=Bosea sp. TWI1241 TaxID=3148904 RepID=UPI00320B1797
MSRRHLAPALALAFSMAAGSAIAQTQTAPDAAISLDEARRIATQNGLVRVEKIELDDGVWEVKGRDNVGAEIEIELRADNGNIIKIERDRPVTAGTPPRS